MQITVSELPALVLGALRLVLAVAVVLLALVGVVDQLVDLPRVAIDAQRLIYVCGAAAAVLWAGRP